MNNLITRDDCRLLCWRGERLDLHRWNFVGSLRLSTELYHDDVIKWKNFPRHRSFMRGIHRSPVNSPHKGQWRGALMFSLICAWINGWVNNREAGDLRRHRAHYDVIVMIGYGLRSVHDDIVTWNTYCVTDPPWGNPPVTPWRSLWCQCNEWPIFTHVLQS